jgi:small-conductance mechanosensitive channel
VAGVVLGFAAQKSLGTLLAGIQIAFSQPIRLDDVVIVDGQWGRVEEITLTYVVVKIWDERRLIVPITYFIDNAFQNWTRSSAQILGTVYVYADYRLPVDELRAELKRILDDNPLFDGRAWGLQVTNANESTIELRALMSAEDASKSWDLRCAVREALIRYLQMKHPDSLPRIRLEQEVPATG